MKKKTVAPIEAAKLLLIDAKHEITQLRRRNEILSAKVEMFDSMMCLLNTAPAYRSQPASPDIVYAIDEMVGTIEATKR